jgi:hypothetical protein
MTRETFQLDSRAGSVGRVQSNAKTALEVRDRTSNGAEYTLCHAGSFFKKADQDNHGRGNVVERVSAGDEIVHAANVSRGVMRGSGDDVISIVSSGELASTARVFRVGYCGRFCQWITALLSESWGL